MIPGMRDAVEDAGGAEEGLRSITCTGVGGSGRDVELVEGCMARKGPWR